MIESDTGLQDIEQAEAIIVLKIQSVIITGERVEVFRADDFVVQVKIKLFGFKAKIHRVPRGRRISQRPF